MLHAGLSELVQEERGKQRGSVGFFRVSTVDVYRSVRFFFRVSTVDVYRSVRVFSGQYCRCI